MALPSASRATTKVKGSRAWVGMVKGGEGSPAALPSASRATTRVKGARAWVEMGRVEGWLCGGETGEGRGGGEQCEEVE